jgi:pimeloyl-ACP methyl ester carboxylesterase
LRLAYRDWGGTGQPLVLLHGLSSNSRIWDWTAPLLTSRFRVVAVDQRGHGLSDKPSSYTAAEWTGDLEGMLDHLGFDHVTLAGHSWGAGVALQFAADNPERTSAMALVDGGIVEMSSHMTWEEAQEKLRTPDIDGIPVDRFFAFARQWPDMKDLWNDDLQEMVLSNFEVRDGKIYRRLTIDNHMKILHAMYGQRTSEMLASVTSPVLAVIAVQERDHEESRRWLKFRREGARRAEQALRDGRILWMEDTIHDVPIQRPRELAEALITLAP